MKRAVQKLVVGVALRVVHAALVELRSMDATVAAEFAKLPAGTAYFIHTGHACPSLSVLWDGSRLLRRQGEAGAGCKLYIKSLACSFQLFTGQIGLAQGYARHAFGVVGDVADVMRLARLVNRAEAYLFPPFITKRILTDRPQPAASPLRMYARMALGFLMGKY